MFNSLPPIARLAQRILADVENAVKRFPRYHKYTVGSDLRADAMLVARCVHRAWRDSDQKLLRVQELAAAIDDLKITMQLGKQVNAFGSFQEFEAIARLINDLGRQSGGWLKQLVAKSQNAGALAPSQRASILSSRVAPEATL
jgi:hypothetical protein